MTRPATIRDDNGVEVVALTDFDACTIRACYRYMRVLGMSKRQARFVLRCTSTINRCDIRLAVAA